MTIGVVGLERQRLAEARQRLLVTVGYEQHIAAIVERLGIVGLAH